MSEFRIRTDKVLHESGKIEGIARRAGNLLVQYDILKASLRTSLGTIPGLMESMEKLREALQNHQGNLENLSDALLDCVTAYENAERMLLGKAPVSHAMRKAVREVNRKVMQTAREVLTAIGVIIAGLQSGTSAYSGDPVNMCTGSYVYENTELKTGGNDGLRFVRYYNSVLPVSGVMGIGWTHLFEATVTEEGGRLILLKGDGSAEVFERSDGERYVSVFGSGGYMESDDSAYRYLDANGEVLSFGTDGKLLSLKSAHGHLYTMTYDGNMLTRAEDAYGRGFKFDYDEDGLLVCVTDCINRTLKMEYSDRLLTAFAVADGHTQRYEYDENCRLAKWHDARGILKLENEFDEDGRVLCQTMADGTKMLYEYGEKTLTFTDRNGTKTVYHRDDLGRHIKTVYPDGEELLEYNEINKCVAFTDKRGNRYSRQYDSAGNVTEATDALGYVTRFAYDDNHHNTEIITPDGDVMRMAYDEDGHLTHVTDYLGNKTEIAYKDGRISAVRQPDDSVVSFESDEYGNTIKKTDERGFVTFFAFDLVGRLIRTEDADGAVTQYEYDDADRVTRIVNPLGQERILTYTATGNLESVLDFDGNTEYWEYNELDLPVTYTDKAGNATKQEYDNMSNVCRTIRADGTESRAEYDQMNRRVRETDPEGYETLYEYDVNGNLLSESRCGETRRFEYDAMNRNIATVDTTGGRMEVTRDAQGQTVSMTRADGTVYHYKYNPMGTLDWTEDPLGHRIRYQYTSMGFLRELSDDENRTKVYEYYPGGLLKSVKETDGNVTRYEYDAIGRRTKQTLPSGYALYYEYDVLGRQTAVSDTEGNRKSFSYDAAGNIIRRSDADGAVTEYRYSPTGELLFVRDPAGQEIRYTYDALGRMTALLEGTLREEDAYQLLAGEKTDPAVNILRWERNYAGAITKETDAMGNSKQYTYDGLGRVITGVDAEGQETRYEYTAGNQPAVIRYHDGRSAVFCYDVMNRMTEWTDWNGTSKMAYDALGRIDHIMDAFGHITAYNWNGTGQKKEMKLADGTSIRYEYENDRLRAIFAEGREVQYAYDACGRIASRSMHNGLSEKYRYLPTGQIEEMIHTDATGKETKYHYGYDSVGNLTFKKIERPEGTENLRYAYDTAGRLIEVQTDEVTTEQYRYDEAGNRVWSLVAGVETTFTYNVLHQMTQANQITGPETGITEYKYDKNGHLIREVSSRGKVERVYDATGNLSEISLANGENWKFGYNALGTRVLRERHTRGKTHTTRLIPDFTDRSESICATEEAGVFSSFIRDNRLLFGLHGKETDTYQCDFQGSVLSFSKGENAAQSFVYDTFGNLLRGETDERQMFGYTGISFLPGTDSYLTAGREYLPQTGRFAQRDKTQFIYPEMPRTVNLYAYCVNNPVVFVDPMGNDCYIFYLPEWKNEAVNDQRQLMREYGMSEDQVHLVPVKNNNDFINGWNGMGEVNGQQVDIDTVVINMHGNPTTLGYGKNSDNGLTNGVIRYSLDSKDVDSVVLYGCNSGHLDHLDYNIAAEFSKKTNGAPVMASDGTVQPGLTFFNQTDRSFKSNGDDTFKKYLVDGKRKNEGWVVYQEKDGKVTTTIVGDKKMTVTDMIDEMHKDKYKRC